MVTSVIRFTQGEASRQDALKAGQVTRVVRVRPCWARVLDADASRFSHFLHGRLGSVGWGSASSSILQSSLACIEVSLAPPAMSHWPNARRVQRLTKFCARKKKTEVSTYVKFGLPDRGQWGRPRSFEHSWKKKKRLGCGLEAVGEGGLQIRTRRSLSLSHEPF